MGLLAARKDTVSVASVRPSDLAGIAAHLLEVPESPSALRAWPRPDQAREGERTPVRR